MDPIREAEIAAVNAEIDNILLDTSESHICRTFQEDVVPALDEFVLQRGERVLDRGEFVAFDQGIAWRKQVGVLRYAEFVGSSWPSIRVSVWRKGKQFCCFFGRGETSRTRRLVIIDRTMFN